MVLAGRIFLKAGFSINISYNTCHEYGIKFIYITLTVFLLKGEGRSKRKDVRFIYVKVEFVLCSGFFMLPIVVLHTRI